MIMKRNMKKNTLFNVLLSFYKQGNFKNSNLFHIHGYIIVKNMNPKSFISEKCEKLKTFMKNEQ